MEVLEAVDVGGEGESPVIPMQGKSEDLHIELMVEDLGEHEEAWWLVVH